jgi:hypothetical protein
MGFWVDVWCLCFFVLVVFNVVFVRLYRNFLVSLSLILCKLRYLFFIE